MRDLLADIRFAARMLAKSPGFTAVAVLTLALGIGANTAIFSVANTVLLRPLPFPDADRLVVIREALEDWEQYAGRKIQPGVNFLAHQDRLNSFERMAGFLFASYHLTGVDEPEQISGAYATENFFALLGVQATVGRLLQPADLQQRARVAVLSHQLWTRRFSGDPEIIGQSIRLSDESFTVIGILPSDFRFRLAESRVALDVWTPITLYSGFERGFPVSTIGRLRPGVSLGEAYAEVDALRRGLIPPSVEGAPRLLVLRTLREDIVHNVREGIVLLMAAVGCVLLIACANVANLLLSRGMQRQGEMAIRTTLGAGRWRLARQMLTEGLVLAAAGCVPGVILAWWLQQWLVSISFQQIPRLDQIAVDLEVAAFAIVLSVVTGVLFSVLPALRVSEVRLGETLKQGGMQSGIGRTPRILRNGLVIGEIALSFVLVVGAGLMVNTFIRLNNLELNFDPRNVLAVDLQLPRPIIRDPERRLAFYDAAIEKVRTLPGVEAVGVTDFLPPERSYLTQRFRLPGQQYASAEEAPIADRRYSDPGFFRMLKIPVLEGRVFIEEDRFRSNRLLVINEVMARAVWPGDSAVGKQIVLFEGRDEVPAEVIGVVRNVRSSSLTGELRPSLYMDYRQAAFGASKILIRTSVEPLSLAPAVKKAIWEVDKNQPFRLVTTMEQHIANTQEYAEPRFYTALLGAFGGLALALAAVGLFGVISFSVTRRSREFGLRMALGARPGAVLRQVLREGAKLAAPGLVLGLAGALASAQVLSHLLYEISPTDTLTYVCVALILAGAVLAGCYLPARRAARIDPIQALRYE